MITLITCICEGVIVLASSRQTIFFINFGISKQLEDLSLFSAVCIIMQQELKSFANCPKQLSFIKLS